MDECKTCENYGNDGTCLLTGKDEEPSSYCDAHEELN